MKVEGVRSGQPRRLVVGLDRFANYRGSYLDLLGNRQLFVWSIDLFLVGMVFF